MPLSQEFKIRARRYLGRKKTVEVSVPYRERVGEAVINTWGDGLLNLRFLFTHRLGLTQQITPWGPAEIEAEGNVVPPATYDDSNRPRGMDEFKNKKRYEKRGGVQWNKNDPSHNPRKKQ